MKKFIHMGCGQKYKDKTTRGFASDDWLETRYDIDKLANPDIVGSMLDMSKVKSASYDALFSSHNIEHLYAFQVPVAIREFARVLKDDGFAVITCPDLQSVSELIADDKLLDAAYNSPSGPITPMDIVYGHMASIASGNDYMAHRCGFTHKVLVATLNSNGFPYVASKRRGAPHFDLWAIASKSKIEESQIRNLAKEHFPS